MTLLSHALAFLLGVFLASMVGGVDDLWLALAWAFVGLRVLRPTWQGPRGWRPLRAHPLTAAALLALGAARFAATAAPLHDPAHIAHYALAHEGARVRLVGRVVRPPQRIAADTWALVLAVERVRPLSSDSAFGRALPLRGRLLVRLQNAKAASWQYGDRVVVEGVLLPLPQGRASYRAYLARLGAAARLTADRGGRLAASGAFSWRGMLYALRARAYALVRRYWPAPEGPLFGGILLGLEQDIAPDLYEAFRATGTAHIIVISGFNLTVLAALVIRLTGRVLGRSWGALAAAGALGLYTLLVGADPAVLRAALMAGLGLLARQVGRRQHGFTTLALSAAVMTAAQPWALWDIGFQLSFAATLGLMLYADPLGRLAERGLQRMLPRSWAARLRPWVEEFFLLTLAAQALTLPLSAYYFHRIAPVSILANPLILPAQGPLMVLGGLAVLVGLVAPPIGQGLAWLAWPWAAYTIRVTLAVARWAGPGWHVGYWSGGTLVLLYAALAWGTWRARAGRLPRRVPPSWVAVGLLALNLALWSHLRARPDGWLHLWIWPLPGSPAVLVQFPRGPRVLINGGQDPARLDHALGSVLSPAQRRLSAWVVTDNRAASSGALGDLLTRYPPEQVWWLPQRGRSPEVRVWQSALVAQGVPLEQAVAGAALSDGSAQLLAQTVGPGGGALEVRYGAFRAVLYAGHAEHLGPAHVWLLPGEGPTRDLWRLSATAVPAGPGQGVCWWLEDLGPVHLWSNGRRWGVAATRGATAPASRQDCGRPQEEEGEVAAGKRKMNTLP